ncbi:MAG: adenylate/guanylate cyclase domain-containing protein [Bacteroidota bacterium]
MDARRRRRKNIIRDFSIGWTIGVTVFFLISTVPNREFEEAGVPVWGAWVGLLVMALLVGTISGYVQYMWEERYYRRMPLAKLVGIKIGFTLFFVLVLVTVRYFVALYIFRMPVEFGEFILREESISFYIFFFFMDVILSLLRQVNILLGPGNLRRLVRGEFYTPKEGTRIFMFIDLKSSTEAAEKLGHIRYSRMLQECFDDLAVVGDYDAEIYQYVGDEVVLTWPMQSGFKDGNCVKAFYAFAEQLRLREGYYKAVYGWVPFFKAGMNAGEVVVAEVGRYRREIAYHGDTINTAARIQGQCNGFNRALLVSEKMVRRLSPLPGYEFEGLGEISLKGKQEQVAIYAVHPAGDSARSNFSPSTTKVPDPSP